MSISTGKTGSNPITVLFTFLSNLGKVTKPKKDNAKGVIVYNPQPFQLQEAELLASECGFQVIHKPIASEYEGRMVPPSLFVGVVTNELTEDEATSFLSSLQ